MPLYCIVLIKHFFPSFLLCLLIRILLPHLFIQLFVSVWIHGYLLFYGFLFNLLLKLFQLWPLELSLGWPLCPFNIPLAPLPPTLKLYPYFLVPQNAPGSFYIFHVPTLESPISPRHSGSFF